MRKLIFAVAAAVLVAAAVSCRREPPRSVDQLLRAALAHGVAGDWSLAADNARKALEQEPENVDALVMHAISLSNDKERDKALDEIRRAADLGPRHFMAQYFLGKMLFELGRYADCVAPLNAAAELRPGNESVLALIARNAATLRSPDATRHYAALAKTPGWRNRPEPYNELGVILARRKNIKEAAQCFQQARKLAPQNPRVTLNMAIFLDGTINRPETAARYYREYLRLIENNPTLVLQSDPIEARLRQIEGR